MSIAREIPIPESAETRGHLEPMNLELARRTAKWYVCSRCWGDLTMKEQDGGAVVECVNCQEETYGYVTRHWTERRRNEDQFTYKEVTRMLQRIGVLPKQEGSREVLLKEIGF